jgi:hypothetical protein
MSSIDKELVEEFQRESKDLISQMTEILEACESDFKQVKSLENYGQLVDRIMGAAKSLQVLETKAPDEPPTLLENIGNYAEICKAVSYKASQISSNEQFYNICVALLLDGTEVLETMVLGVSGGGLKLKDLFSLTFLDRLKWVSTQFAADVRATLSLDKQKTKMKQDDIDDLLKKLGLD